MSGLPSLRTTALRRREHYPNLLGAWGFAEGSGTLARDSSGNGRSLTVDAGITWPAGHSGGAGLGNTGVAGSAHAAWNILASPVTLMGWARPADLTAGTSRPLFGIWTSADTSSSTQLALFAQRGDFGTSNVLQGNVRVNGGLVAVNQTALSINTWVHVALTYDGSDIRLFRNGTEVGTFNITGSIDAGSFSFCVAPSPAQTQVDDIRMFNTALGAPQITAFMGNPVAPL